MMASHSSESGEMVEKGNSDSSAAAKKLQVQAHINDLPLSLLFDRLDFRNQQSCRAVCRTWRETPIFQIMPSLLSYDSNEYTTCTLINPFEAQPYTFKISEKSSLHMLECDVLHSRNGWLLLENKDRVFFYNAFTVESIKGPPFNGGNDFRFDRATFSSEPTSTDCIIFAVGCRDSKIRINIWHSGDEGWTLHTIDDRNCTKIRDLVSLNNVFYCVFDDGILGAFEAKKNKWSWLSKLALAPKIEEKIEGKRRNEDSPPHGYIWKEGPIEATYELHMAGYEGDLLLVCEDSAFHLFKFDMKNTEWVEEKLGNRILFLGDQTSSYAVPATGEARGLGNKIYYYGASCCWVYSFEEGVRAACPQQYPQITRGTTRKAWIKAFSY